MEWLPWIRGSLGNDAGTFTGGLRHAGVGQLRDVFRERGRVPFKHEQVDLGEGSLDPGGVKRLVTGAKDPLSRRGLGVLAGIEQLLGELLPGPGTHDLDRDVTLGL